jgi:hypothetical protein
VLCFVDVTRAYELQLNSWLGVLVNLGVHPHAAAAYPVLFRRSLSSCELNLCMHAASLARGHPLIWHVDHLVTLTLSESDGDSVAAAAIQHARSCLIDCRC